MTEMAHRRPATHPEFSDRRIAAGGSTRWGWLLAITVVVTACGAPARTAMVDRTRAFDDEDKLAVALERSPSGGKQLTFCAKPAPGVVNLTNAAWLAFFAANEYAHLHYLAPTMRTLGFRDQRGKGFDWPACTKALRLLRGFEKKHARDLAAANEKGPAALKKWLAPFTQAHHPQAWSRCAADWFEDSDYDGNSFPAAAFEHWLVQTAHPGFRLQFVSGGRFVLEGKAFTEGSTQALFARHETLPIVIVSFRGTEPDKLSDVLVDGKSWKTRLDKHGYTEAWGSIHAGFRAAFESVAPVMRDKLAELDGQSVGVWLTGHSLGGALATVMAAELLSGTKGQGLHHLRGVYTFGSPRVGNSTFQQQFEKSADEAGVRVVRFRNANDAVTHIPGIIGYKHVGTLAYLTEAGLAFPETEPSYSGMGGLGSVGDHNMVGWDAEGQPVSGYYRAILEALSLHPSGHAHNTCL